MLHGLDDVPWAGLGHAHGPADDAPELLRQAASASDATGEAFSALYGSIFHQGTVYPATVAAVPFLVELARPAPARRAEFVWMLGMLADSEHADGTARTQVHAAVVAQVPAIVPLLSDPDPQLRTAAAYTLAQCDTPPALLWGRWRVEKQPEVSASLLLALGRCDPDGSAGVVTEAVVAAPPPVRLAAALALVRNRLRWPDDATAAVAAALDDGAEIEYSWQRHGDPTTELLLDTDDEIAAALLGQLLAASSAATRQSAIWAMTIRSQARRSAPALLLPLVRPLLEDPDEAVREEAVQALRRRGRAAGRYADEVARVAGRYAETAGQPSRTSYASPSATNGSSPPAWTTTSCGTTNGFRSSFGRRSPRCARRSPSNRYRASLYCPRQLNGVPPPTGDSRRTSATASGGRRQADG